MKHFSNILNFFTVFALLAISVPSFAEASYDFSYTKEYLVAIESDNWDFNPTGKQMAAAKAFPYTKEYLEAIESDDWYFNPTEKQMAAAKAFPYTKDYFEGSVYSD